MTNAPQGPGGIAKWSARYSETESLHLLWSFVSSEMSRGMFFVFISHLHSFLTFTFLHRKVKLRRVRAGDDSEICALVYVLHKMLHKIRWLEIQYELAWSSSTSDLIAFIYWSSPAIDRRALPCPLGLLPSHFTSQQVLRKYLPHLDLETKLISICFAFPAALCLLILLYSAWMESKARKC